MPEEEKAALRARKQTHDRNHRARHRDVYNAAALQRYHKLKLDPVKWEALKQKQAEYNRKWRLKDKAEREKKRKRALTDVNDDDDGDDSDSDAPPAQVQIAIPGDNVVVISSDEDDGSGADSSGSSVEGIEFVYSDEEQ